MFNIEKAQKIQSCEDPDTIYLDDGTYRLIFTGGKYIGWYQP